MHALLVSADTQRIPSAVHQALARRGHDVTSTVSMQSALAMQRSIPADILVIDWSCAKGSAAAASGALLRAAREKQSAVLAVVRPETGDLEEALEAGVNDYLSLPLSPRTVEARVAVVERWLEQLRSQRAPENGSQGHHFVLDVDFAAILDACPEPICIHRKRAVLYGNPALAASLGVESTAALQGINLAEVIHPDDLPAVEQRLTTIEKTGQPSSLREERFVARDGSLRVGEAHSFLIRLDDGPAIVSLGRDLTERRAFEEQFHHSERLASVGALAASVAHELNNPLMLVLFNLADLSRSLPTLVEHAPEPVVAHLERRVHAIEEAADQMRSLAHDLTDFVRDKEVQSQPVELKPLLERSVRMVLPFAKDRADIRVDAQLDDVGSVQGSETRLLQVFLNLLINAVDAVAASAPVERRISVQLLREHDQVVTLISDSGPGVPEDLRTRIFEPFFSTKSPGKGTGLGLAVAKSIVDNLRGTIKVLDTQGGGATFEIRLPSADSES